MKNNLSYLRKNKGLSQSELASYLCVSRQTISSIECGIFNPSLELGYKISSYFDTLIELVFPPPRAIN